MDDDALEVIREAERTVEARIIGLVARLHPDVFGTLDSYCAHHRDYLDQTIGRFDREVLRRAGGA